MKNSKVILILIFAMLFSIALIGCSDMTEIDKYKEMGYTVQVTYNGNGGNYIGSQAVSLVDMFNPDKFTADSDGKVHIKLTEPTSKLRPSGGSDPVTLSMQGYFFAGWYKSRELKKDADGNVLDWNDRVLEEIDGIYYVKGTDPLAAGYPACTSYSDYWDFETDTIDVDLNGDKEVSITLYAGWVPYYSFDYYYQQDGQWTKYATTSFDYKATNAEGSTTSDRDTIFMPKYESGAMNYKTAYSDGRSYDFPQREGYTFDSAYLDSQCTQKIDQSFTHQGSVDLESGKAVNSVQNIYVKFLDGVIYKIQTAEELSKNGDADGIYYINSDLDFTSVEWPNALKYNAFEGQFYGNGHKISNLNVTFNSASARCGGLFGSIASGAVIKDLTIENLTFDYAATGRINGGSYGLVAGDISNGADVSITLAGALNLKIGAISLNTVGNAKSTINVLAGGDVTGITYNENDITLTIYGKLSYGSNPPEYNYNFKKEVTVDSDGYLNIAVGGINKYDQESYTISIGGQNE